MGFVGESDDHLTTCFQLVSFSDNSILFEASLSSGEDS